MPALVLSLVVYFALLVSLYVPVAARRYVANTSHSPFHPFPTFPHHSSPEDGLTTSHTYHLTAALGVLSLIYYLSARALRRAVSVSTLLRIIVAARSASLELGLLAPSSDISRSRAHQNQCRHAHQYEISALTTFTPLFWREKSWGVFVRTRVFLGERPLWNVFLLGRCCLDNPVQS
ncbi:hypothetical protein B0H11DRAFT_1193526 [Mycena galericulata]|nr:hypothetical protein B0H11DRAFT_1193526 [Mycena galericulata]